MSVSEFLVPGVRQLEEDGRLASAAASGKGLEAIDGLLVIDLEMSGANALMHEILDIGGVLAEPEPGFPERTSWGARVRPRHIGNADIGALKVVGYNQKGWKDALELEDAFGRFVEMGRGAVLAGWGIGQDIAFLAGTCRRLGVAWPFAPVAVDIQSIARVGLDGTGEVYRFNLGHVADRLGIGRMGEHGALADAYATYDVLVKLYERAAVAAGPA